MVTVTAVGGLLQKELLRQGTIADGHSVNRVALRVYLTNQARIIATHAPGGWHEWLLRKTFLLAARAMPCSVFHFHMMAVANTVPSLDEEALQGFVVVVHRLRDEMRCSPEEVVGLVQEGFSYHEEHPCTPQAAYEDQSYVVSYVKSLAKNWI